MALIEASRFTALKARVKAECLRRNVSTGSVAAYGGTGYDYTTTPASGKKVAKEHYEKLSVPLNAINSNTFPTTSGTRIISGADLTAMETFLDTAEKTSKTTKSHNDCSASCTGLCQSCTGSCTGGCSDACTGKCRNSCEGCTGCSDTCYGSCVGSCQSGCYGTCSTVCARTSN